MSTYASFILADNQDISRAGLHAYISEVFTNTSTHEVSTKKELIAALTDIADCVVVLDYTLFDLRGVEDLLVIRARFPRARWVLFSNELSEDFIRKLCALGNVSIVLKENAGEEIKLALKCTARGEHYLCHQITGLIAGGFATKGEHSGLTATEIEILKLIAKGATVKEMAAERCSSTHTIITHKKNIFRKIGVNNVYEATKYALRAGLVEVMEYYI